MELNIVNVRTVASSIYKLHNPFDLSLVVCTVINILILRHSTMMKSQPHDRELPEQPPSFEGLTPTSITAEANAILEKGIKLGDDLVATLTHSTATFANLILPLITFTNIASSRLSILSTLLSAVSTSPEIRDAAHLITKQMAAAEMANYMRRDVAGLVAAVYNTRQEDDPDRDDQDRYLLGKMNSEYLKSGAGVRDEDPRARLVEATKELSELKAAAQKTLNQIGSGVAFSRAELEGVPEKTLASMKEDETGLWVVEDNHVRAVLRYAMSGESSYIVLRGVDFLKM